MNLIRAHSIHRFVYHTYTHNLTRTFVHRGNVVFCLISILFLSFIQHTYINNMISSIVVVMAVVAVVAAAAVGVRVCILSSLLVRHILFRFVPLRSLCAKLRIRFLYSDDVAYAVYICIVYRIIICSARDIHCCQVRRWCGTK